MHAPVELADIAAGLLARICERVPRVHCITHSVAQQHTANMPLAVGAIPSMTVSPEEIGGFVTGADALRVNLGTFDSVRCAAVDVALGVAAKRKLPWLLDPVFIERSSPRAEFARAVLRHQPSMGSFAAAMIDALHGLNAAALRVRPGVS